MFQKLILISVLAVLLTASFAAAGEPPRKGGQFPDIKLAVPDNEAEKKYLGFCDEEFFAVPDIKAEVVIVEIFSMYCPHCQAAAPDVNMFYEKILNDPALKDRVKLIGIGAGNTAMEVDVFREKYNVAFPLFADGDFTFHKMLGEVHTPYFIGIRKLDDGGHTLFFSELGGFDDPDAWLKRMIGESGLK